MMKIRIKKKVQEAKKWSAKNRPPFDEMRKLHLAFVENDVPAPWPGGQHFWDYSNQQVEDFQYGHIPGDPPPWLESIPLDKWEKMSPEERLSASDEALQAAHSDVLMGVQKEFFEYYGWTIEEFRVLSRKSMDDQAKDIRRSQKILSPGYLSHNDPSVKAVFDQHDDAPDDEPEYKETAGIKSWFVITIPTWALETWKQDDEAVSVPWDQQKEFQTALHDYFEMIKRGKPVPNLQDHEKAAIAKDRRKLLSFGKSFWLSLPGDRGRQLPIQKAGGGEYEGGSRAAVLLHIDPERVVKNPEPPKQKSPKQKNVKYENVFES